MGVILIVVFIVFAFYTIWEQDCIVECRLPLTLNFQDGINFFIRMHSWIATNKTKGLEVLSEMHFILHTSSAMQYLKSQKLHFLQLQVSCRSNNLSAKINAITNSNLFWHISLGFFINWLYLVLTVNSSTIVLNLKYIWNTFEYFLFLIISSTSN